MATMIHFDSPMLSRGAPAEKENNLKMLSKNGGGKGGTENQPLPRKRMALKAVNGENVSMGKLNQQTPKTGRVALSNLTNTVSAQKTPKVEMLKAPSSSTKSAVKARPAGLTKRRVPDIEQPYPKKVMPIFEDVPRLPKNWTNGLSDIWAMPSLDAFEDGAKMNISIEAVPLPYAAASPLLDLDDVSFDFSADLDRDLCEDAKSLAAELLSEAWTLEGMP